jgi:hypothetical protein
MKWSFASVGMIVLGITGIAIILLFQQITTSNENDYYLLKEITEASMIESIDIKYYRETGDLRIVKEKFVENFTRRYSESTLFIGTKYTISFFDIIEVPPKVTIMIDTGLEQYRIYNDTSNYNVVNNLTGILEFTGKNTSSKDPSKVYTKGKTFEKTYYAISKSGTNGDSRREFNEPIKLPKELDQSNISNIKPEILNTEVINGNNVGEILTARLKEPIDWVKRENSEIDLSIINQNDYIISDFESAIYNCKNKQGKFQYGMCDKNYKDDKDDKDDIWIYWKGLIQDYNQIAIIKLKVKFTYDEYEYEYDKEEFK